MATTMAAPVNNNISLAQRFLPILDAKYKKASVTAFLDMLEERVQWDGAKTVKLFEVSTNGLANYDRNGGYVPGSEDGSWEPYTLNVDRGRSFTIDAMDNEESMGLAFGTLLGEFERVDVVPEIDAYRFAKYVSEAGLHSPVVDPDGVNVNFADLIQDAIEVLDNSEVPSEGRILFVSPKAYRILKGNITRFTENGDPDVNGNVEMYEDMRVVKVPNARFNTAIQLNAPTDATTSGGYSLLGATINFMIIHPSAIMQVIKHRVPKIIPASVNQSADGDMLNYRVYHDAFVKKNKKNGIYFCASVPATPMSASASTSTITAPATATITISNAQGAVTAVSSDETKATVEVNSSGNVVITGVAAGSATVTVSDAIGQSLEISVTVS